MRHDLERAYDECVRLRGREAAISAVEKVAGTMFVTRVTDDLADATIAELSAGLMKAKASPVARLKLVHDSLNAMAASIFGAQ